MESSINEKKKMERLLILTKQEIIQKYESRMKLRDVARLYGHLTLTIQTITKQKDALKVVKPAKGMPRMYKQKDGLKVVKPAKGISRMYKQKYAVKVVKPTKGISRMYKQKDALKAVKPTKGISRMYN